MDLDKINMRKKEIESFALLINDSLNVETSQLTACLDDILNTFSNYFKLFEKSETELKTFNNHLVPIIEQKQNELYTLYHKIDNLELFINCLNKSYDQLESKMQTAERKYKNDIFHKYMDPKLLTNKLSKENSFANKTTTQEELNNNSNKSNNINNIKVMESENNSDSIICCEHAFTHK